jgi:hypothetical protein
VKDEQAPFYILAAILKSVFIKRHCGSFTFQISYVFARMFAEKMRTVRVIYTNSYNVFQEFNCR